jgi:hypothetical protein
MKSQRKNEMRNGTQSNKAQTKHLAGPEILGWPAGKNQVIAKHQAQTEYVPFSTARAQVLRC